MSPAIVAGEQIPRSRRAAFLGSGFRDVSETFLNFVVVGLTTIPRAANVTFWGVLRPAKQLVEILNVTSKASAPRACLSQQQSCRTSPCGLR